MIVKKWFILAQISFMKKILLPLIIVLVAGLYSSCIKNTPYVTTPTPYMNVAIGPYIFNTTTVYPSTLTSKNNDTSVTLYITGDQLATKEKIILTITYYTGKAGKFSIAAKEASATYLHYTGTSTYSTGTSIALGGLVVITKFTPDCMVGYFNFDTNDSLSLINGTFSCPIPDYVAHP